MKTFKIRWWQTAFSVLFFAAALVALHTGLLADEGMWTFDSPPLTQLKDRYGFTPTEAWLDHVRLSSVRFNDGGSGSFVSPHGLVLTNHHVALFQLQKLSTPEHDYASKVFYARTEAQELKCPDLELNILMSMENVTARVMEAVKPGMTDADALRARRAEIAKIQKESLDATGLRSDVVNLYLGSEYWLYRYKKYTDVRLVFAPSQQIAFFGGDPDNFTYPRYDLDFALFRVYESGKPIESNNYLRWDAKGPVADALVFVPGNPGSTGRQDTVAQLQVLRDKTFPLVIQIINHRLAVLEQYSAQGPEQARQAASSIFFLQNSLKAYDGMENGLRNPELMAKKEDEEKDFRARIAANPEWQREYGGAWNEIAHAQNEMAQNLKPYRFRSISGATLANEALTIVQYVQQVQKPDGERLPGFHESQLTSLRFQLFSPAPSYLPLEQAMLTGVLRQSSEELGPADPFVRAALQGKSPEEAASEAFAATRMGDAAFRKSLVEGGVAAVDSSNDPLIALARRINPEALAMIKWHEDKVESIETRAGEEIGKARFAVYGKSTYPDATFTLRLAYGTVKGYPMNGTEAPPYTTFYGLYDRTHSFGLKPPFNVPELWMKSESKLDLKTPLDFVTTCDVVGGNSGSPVINRDASVVGVIFDGNIESLVGYFVYNGKDNRSVAVATTAIIEALRKVYDAGPLADELEGQSAATEGE
ncbi:MAG: S46 family peptidase [Acidobacteria bacterium]|nr:MAG: S46 family peptidase [Acidobacteriota bacterium]